MNPHLRDCWKEAGYPHEMGSAAVVPPPLPEFRRVYHLTAAEHAISNIAFGRLKVARISELNDPFELRAPNSRDKRIRKLVTDFYEVQNQQIGFLSFSGNWINPVLWGHYGARHRGICLGFDVHHENLQKIEYEENRLTLDLDQIQSGFSEDLQFRLLKTKFKHWEYEWEFRRAIQLNTCKIESYLHFFEFDRSIQLREVILGLFCTYSVEDVRNFVGSRFPDVKVFRTRLAHKTFSVAPEEASVP